jgi:hypothetical protein
VTNAYFSVNPNPFNDELKVVFNTGAAEREIILIDISGRVVDVVSSSSSTVSIPTHGLASGVYLLKVVSEKDKYSARVVRQ